MLTENMKTWFRGRFRSADARGPAPTQQPAERRPVRLDPTLPRTPPPAASGVSPYAQLRQHIVPEIRTLAEQAHAGPLDDVWPLVGNLFVALSADRSEERQPLPLGQLLDWGCSEEQVFADALGNLRRMSNAEAWQDGGQGLRIATFPDPYTASRILLPDVIRSQNVADPVVMIPTRTTLLLASGQDPAALRCMAATALARLNELDRDDPRPDGPASHDGLVSFTPMVLNAGNWQVFRPPESLAPLFADLLTVERTVVSNLELPRLRHRLVVSGETGVILARVHLGQTSAESPWYTYCVWKEGDDTLLPMTDRVLLKPRPIRRQMPLDDSFDGLLVRWADLEHQASSLLEPTADHPVRFRARRFPSPEMLMGLKAKPGSWSYQK